MSATASLERYAAFLESVRTGVPPDLETLVRPDVIFRDPFNAIRGVAGFRRVLEDMLTHVSDLDFRVTHTAMAPARHGGPTLGLMRWELEGRLASLRDRAWRLEGCSEIGFDDDGRVSRHVDYWDAASGLYEHVPLLGRCLALLRRRIAIDPVEQRGDSP